MEAYRQATAATDADIREEWLRAAALWEDLVREYAMLEKASDADQQESVPEG